LFLGYESIKLEDNYLEVNDFFFLLVV